MDECKPLSGGAWRGVGQLSGGLGLPNGCQVLLREDLDGLRRMWQGLALVHIRAQLEQLQDTVMSQPWSFGGQKSAS
jgi:hypothetical protein